MKKLGSHTVGIDGGEIALFSDYEDGGDMWTGRGQRERRRHVTFSEPYLDPPHVQVALSLWDLDTASPIRADLRAEAVSPTGFDMVFRTWGDSRIARARISWTAIGALADADDWDVD